MSHSPIKSQKSNSPSNLPAHFLVRVYDTKNSEVYQRKFIKFKDAYQFYLQREPEIGNLWKRVDVIEVVLRVIDPGQYSDMNITY
tara:strand:- start:9492 stop:9746 length:255 start_codon:yes stop_codon:yes gene_type:complete